MIYRYREEFQYMSPESEPTPKNPGGSSARKVVKELKNIGFNLGFLVAIPVLIPAALASITVSSIKDRFIRCPRCNSNQVELKGHSFKPGTASCRPGLRRRNQPCFSFYQCVDCGCQSKKLFGEHLSLASDEEFATLIPIENEVEHN